MHDSKTVANEFLRLAREADKSLTPMQLLKLVYIAHGWSLGLYGKALIRDEVQAWQYGPVIPRLYNAVRDYRDSPVSDYLKVTAPDVPLTPTELSVIRQVFSRYGSRSGAALSRLTHAHDSPWAHTYRPGEFGRRISNELIRDHYERLAEPSAPN